ncbi:hypothetical protein GCM10010420_39160 [Streptomyces glaucosporus]|uniref:DUF1877 family protein n=1 Tax=Streptomyces glaucosporus TaxID=284044 RepID=A0ABP5VMU8_9ACTN
MSESVPGPRALWREALAGADRAFTPPPALRGPVRGCAFCRPEEELLLLGGAPDAVPDDLFLHFMHKTPGHWMPDQYPVLWRRLMPRALRHWGPDGGSFDHARELSRLGPHGADLPTWPEDERTAVERAFRALLTTALTGGGSPYPATELVEGIACATDGPEPWLEHLARLPGPDADTGLVRLARRWTDDLLRDDLRFWWYDDGAPRVIAEWLPTLRPRLARIAARHPHPGTAGEAREVLDLLREAPEHTWLSVDAPSIRGMGMTGNYARLTPAEYERAHADPEWAHGFVLETAETEWRAATPAGRARFLDVDKTWHALQFLLDRAGFPLDIVLCDEPLPGAPDWGCTPPLRLGPDEVATAAGALAELPFDALVRDLRAEEMTRADVYPTVIWERDGADALDYVRHHYEDLRLFFTAAARDGDTVLTWIS